MMKPLRALSLFAALAVPVAGCSKVSRQEVRDELSVSGYGVDTNEKGLPSVDYRIAGQQIPLVNFDSWYSRGAYLFDRNGDNLLAPEEVLDFANVVIDDGDGIIGSSEYGKLSWANVFSSPVYLQGDILPENPYRVTRNLKVTSDNIDQLCRALQKDVYWGGAKIEEGNITRAHINSILAEIIKAENITGSKEDVDSEVNRKIAILGGSCRYLESNEDFRKVAEATVLRRKAVDFLLENKNPKWITKLQAS